MSRSAADSGEEGVTFCDVPAIPADLVGKFLMTQMAAVAELEAGLVSQRTKAALTEAKRRCVRLGNYRLRAGETAAARIAVDAASAQSKERVAAVSPFIHQAHLRLNTIDTAPVPLSR